MAGGMRAARSEIRHQTGKAHLSASPTIGHAPLPGAHLTSTSSHNMPANRCGRYEHRDCGLRLRSMAAATLSAPTASAAASRGTKMVMVSVTLMPAPPPRCRSDSPRPDAHTVRHPAWQLRLGAEAETEDRLQRDSPIGGRRVPVDTEFRLRLFRQRPQPIDWQASARQSFRVCRPAGWSRKSW